MLHLRKPSAALTVSPSALVLLAAFLLLSRGLTLPAALLSAALCHELAHALTLHALHTPPRRLTLSATGAELYVPDLHRLSYGGELLAVAAGPGCNLLLWALLSSVGGEALAPFAGAHLILGALNLLPVRPMDGGRLLWLLTALCTEPYTADRVAYAVGAVASAALLVLCLYLTLTTGAGLFLLPGVLWLAVKGVLPNGAKPDKISCYKEIAPPPTLRRAGRGEDYTMDKRLERILPRVQKACPLRGRRIQRHPQGQGGGRHPHRLLLPGYLRDRYVQPGYAYPLRRNEQYPRRLVRARVRSLGRHGGRAASGGNAPFALESGDPITDYDIVALLRWLRDGLSRHPQYAGPGPIPLHAADRTGLTPLVIAGGTAMYNAEPLTDFIDLVSLGEGEDVTVELVELHRRARREGWSKADFLRAAARLDGIYVPSLYDVTYHDDGTVASITPRDGAPAVVTKRIVHDMDKSYFPVNTIVPPPRSSRTASPWSCSGAASAAAASVRRAMSTARSAIAAATSAPTTASAPATTPAIRRSRSPACPPATTRR